MESVTEKRIQQVVDFGFRRVLFVLGRKGRDADWEALEGFAALASRFR